jgi:hypothetical protein
LVVVGPGCDQHTSGGDALTVFEHHHRPGTIERQPGDRRRDRELGAKLLRLEQGAAHELGAGDAGREAQVILDLH